MYKKILTVLLLTGIVFSQQKIGIVFSEKIRLDFEEFKDVEQQLQLELEVIQNISTRLIINKSSFKTNNLKIERLVLSMKDALNGNFKN